jgi:hypothetical protein
MSAPCNIEPDAAKIVTEAVVRVQSIFKLTDADIGAILGIDSSSDVQRKKCHALVLEGEKQWESALLLIRIFRSLSVLVGKDDQALRYWLSTDNFALNGRPIDVIKTAEGLIKIARYLDAMTEET